MTDSLFSLENSTQGIIRIRKHNNMHGLGFYKKKLWEKNFRYLVIHIITTPTNFYTYSYIPENIYRPLILIDFCISFPYQFHEY